MILRCARCDVKWSASQGDTCWVCGEPWTHTGADATRKMPDFSSPAAPLPAKRPKDEREESDPLKTIRDAWSRETSADPYGWGAHNPAWGQCAVTALVVQDLLGGELLRAEVAGVSHYWNLLPDGRELDLTFEQFPRDTPTPSGERRAREYVLSFAATRKRYEELKRRVQDA